MVELLFWPALLAYGEAAVAYVGDADIDVFADFALDSQIPLLRVASSVRVYRPVENSLVVVKPGIDEWWSLEALREAILQVKGRDYVAKT